MSLSFKDRSRGRLRDAVKYGKVIKPTRCQRCSAEVERRLLHGHHHNGYENALDVVWLCITCHNKVDIEVIAKSGSDNSNARFSRDQIAEIRRKREAGEPVKSIASEFDAALKTIYSILNKETYAN